MLIACQRRSSPLSDDDESGASTVLRPHLSQDRPDLVALERDANHGCVPRLTGNREHPRTPDEGVGVAGDVDADLVSGREVVGRRRERKGERRPGVLGCSRGLDGGRSGRPEGEVQREEEGAGSQAATGQREAPGRASGGPEE